MEDIACIVNDQGIEGMQLVFLCSPLHRFWCLVELLEGHLVNN